MVGAIKNDLIFVFDKQQPQKRQISVKFLLVL